MHVHTFHSLLLLILIRICATQDQQSINCARLFSCGGTIRHIGYPFWGGDRPSECGVPGLELRCSRDNLTTIHLAGQSFHVHGIDVSNSLMRIERTNRLDDFCPEMFDDSLSINLTVDGDPRLGYSPNVENLYLFFSCPSEISDRNGSRFSCTINGTNRVGYVADESLSGVQVPNGTSCEPNSTFPVMKRAVQELRRNGTLTITTLTKVVNQGFEVDYRRNGVTACGMCVSSGGLCWSGTNSETPTCLCPSRPTQFVCRHTGSRLNLGLKIGIGVGAAAISAFTMCVIFFLYHRRYKKRYGSSPFVFRGSSLHPPLVKELERGGVHIFEYHELEEATDRFNRKRELGDGGHGAVYKGKLQDGRTVAVKRLYDNQYRRVEQFINEVEILTRLRHQNLVSLYGCTPCNVRGLLLVYEYIPNGTLADHLHGTRAKPGSLSWITRLNIAIETANALAYLHASDVIHRDIKSTNILLDNNFIVKVADFGISRLRPTDVTHVSTAPQGTPGYVDPEYNEFYQLTEKSDVYSFGVVLVELISSKPAVDIARDRNEINLSTMALHKIQNRALHDLVDPHLGFESDYKVRTMMIDVAELAFQCLQIRRDMRPPMQDVLDVLQGIQGKDYSTDVMDIPADDILQLKSV